jgi:hypothetical protein
MRSGLTLDSTLGNLIRNKICLTQLIPIINITRWERLICLSSKSRSDCSKPSPHRSGWFLAPQTRGENFRLRPLHSDCLRCENFEGL